MLYLIRDYLLASVDTTDLSMIVTILAILLGFVMGISSYLISTPSPALSTDTIQDEEDSKKLLMQIQKLNNVKEYISKWLLFLYVTVLIVVLLIIFTPNRLSLIVFIMTSIIYFLVCSYVIAYITSSNQKINKITNNILMRKFTNYMKNKYSENNETKV